MVYVIALTKRSCGTVFRWRYKLFAKRGVMVKSDFCS